MTANFVATATWCGDIRWHRAVSADIGNAVDSVTLIIDYLGPWRCFRWIDLTTEGWVLDVYGLREHAPDLFDKRCLKGRIVVPARVEPVLGGVLITAEIGHVPEALAVME